MFTIPFWSQEKFANKTIDSLIIVLQNTKIDTSKVALLNKISLKFSDLDPNKGIEFANQALKLSKKINWNDGIANAYFNIAKNNYDLILMDVQMPGMDGYEATKSIRKDFGADKKNIPIIALSANAMPRDIEMGLEAGFFNYLTKPIKVDEFMDALDSALEFAHTAAGRAVGSRGCGWRT